MTGTFNPPHPEGIQNEERLVPAIRSLIARSLKSMGFRVRDIAPVLGVTQPAVIQYLDGRRGKGVTDEGLLADLAEPVVTRAAGLIASRSGRVESVELLEVARQFSILTSDRHSGQDLSVPGGDALMLLRSRLQLEFSAAERYLELSGRARDVYARLLLRMIASDSIRHADVVSRIIAWMEAGDRENYSLPDLSFLEGMLSIEDSASETCLEESISIDHPVARLLLEWIDEDERKHRHIMKKIISLISSA